MMYSRNCSTNSLTNVILPNDKDFLKKLQGLSEYCLAKLNNYDVFATCWCDNKTVYLFTLLFTFVEIDFVSKVKLSSKVDNKSIKIDCLHIVSIYNIHIEEK